VAAKLRRDLGIQVEMEHGSYGEYKVLVDGQTVIDGGALTALGINTERHFRVPSEEVWHEIGHRLAPKDKVWDGCLKAPGMRALLVEGARDDDAHGRILVKVEPSSRVQPGVFVMINDHFDAKPSPDGPGSDLIEHLTTTWPVQMKRAELIVSTLKSLLA